MRVYIRLRYFIPVVISRSGFESVLPFPETIFPQITYSRLRQNPILKISNFPANSGKVRYPNKKIPSAYITRRPERESTSSRGYPPLSFPGGAGKVSADSSLSRTGRRTIYLLLAVFLSYCL